MNLYPLKFDPIFKYRMWGGNKLKTILNKKVAESNIGESWEISAIEGDETVVLNGFLKGKTLPELIDSYQEKLLGDAVYDQFGKEFPLLIKFIDTAKPLSIQVHPNDEYAKEHHNSFGKNEMWYIIQAEDEAEIIVGFNKKMERADFKNAIDESNVLAFLNIENTRSGDAFHIPTGRIHGIGSGILLAEIQQTSDVTYRVYDYDRIDAKTGEKRTLHLEQSLDVLDYTLHDAYKVNYSSDVNCTNKMVETPYFKTGIIPLRSAIEKDYSSTDSFVILICVDGKATLTYNEEVFKLNTGETILVPAAINRVRLSTNTKADILEVSV
ncbi:type I phosphomannose isomerase catalytic subunit [Spongiivirga sp. MCCC 1A20706]|uniref:type I phosphomannose isomerase catalytic subunit n=1 Tax=Spongiivirga sp. MCCC 1A20706 TaxID=3160963 RepID=UPI003977854A